MDYSVPIHVTAAKQSFACTTTSCGFASYANHNEVKFQETEIARYGTAHVSYQGC